MHELPLVTSAYNSDDELGLSTIYLDELYLPRNITALNKLQSDTTHLYEVLQAFSRILKMWEEYAKENLS
ncbi:5604_t:CDS:2 [Scutellospora calospora]|uniref:5604_t:CDS:1 n=1 Tax=Scutellospora calospora TaxID=85575 RepID=A0ACA9MIE8_9GLOM|nr:5604_t:CDS:2 [Scutellospora calospora]